LSDIEEKKLWHTSTHNTDTDGDGYSDYTEVINGYNPKGFGKLDSDGDSLTDYAELTIHWTNRHDTDSDNDGYDDGTEIANGYNPNGTGKW
jgi:Bacterial TSP3 repeat